MSFNIEVQSGSSVRLPTAGKYCDRDIVITATGGTGGGDPTLPAGYVRCGYIRFDGSQVVDTGIVGNQDTKIKVKYTREISTSVYLYGVASSGNVAAITAYLGGYWRFGSKYATVAPTTDAELINTAIQDRTGVDRITANSAYSGVSDFETIGSILIGTARNANGTIGNAQFVGTVVAWEVWQDEEMVQKLIPVVNADGVYRFFDIVSQSFFDSITDTPLDGGNL